jgi:hypothetical protein
MSLLRSDVTFDFRLHWFVALVCTDVTKRKKSQLLAYLRRKRRAQRRDSVFYLFLFFRLFFSGVSSETPWEA